MTKSSKIVEQVSEPALPICEACAQETCRDVGYVRNGTGISGSTSIKKCGIDDDRNGCKR